MKILFILEYYYPNIGGVERLFKNVADGLVEDGHEIMVITHKSQRNLAAFEEIDGVKVRRLPFKSRFTFTFFGLPWILYYGRGVECIHTTSYNAAAPAFIASRLLRKRCYITFHEYWGKLWFQLPRLNYINRLLFYLYEKMISQLPFDKIVAVSDYTRQSLVNSGVNPKRVVLIYNGINYKDFCSFKWNAPVKFTVAYFGRLGVSKGFDILLEAAKIFLKKNDDAFLKLIIPLKPKGRFELVKRNIVMSDLLSNVIFLHHLPDAELKNELSTSSCVVIPSYSEGFCFAAAETIAMGIPLISSDRGALKEVVSGNYIKLEELTVSCLLAALERAKANRWTITPVKHFTLEECVEQYKELYNCKDEN